MSGVGWEVVDGHSDQAQTVTLSGTAATVVPVLAPPGYAGPTTPLDWVPFSGDPLVSLATETYSAGWSISTARGSATDPDEISSGAFVDSWYPAAVIDCYVSGSVDEVYCQIGLTTFSQAAFSGSGLPLAGPNQVGPEVETTGGAATWNIRGNWYGYALLHDDPTALQLEHCVLKFALVPHAMVQPSPDEDIHLPGSQWTWREWPTKAVLDGLTVVHTEAAPLVSDYTWADAGPQDRGVLPLSIDLEIDPSWVVGGYAHLAYWFERTDSADRLFSQDYTGYRTTTALNTWGPVAAGSLASQSYALDSTGNTAGSWSKASDGGLYLDTYTGATAGGRVLYSYGTGSDGRLNGDKRMHWTWLAVADNTFGYAIFASPWSRQLVVTPDGVYDYNVGASALLVAHSTPFATGDVCDVVVTGTTVSVQRGGVEVSTFTLPSTYVFTNNGYWAMHWASTANAGNRLSGVDTYGTPTNRGSVSLYAELDYGDEPSDFASPAITAYRMLQYSEFPVFHKEHWEYSLAQPEWTCWLRLHGPSDAFMVYVGALNTHVGELDPSIGYPLWPQEYAPTWNRCIQRPDGMLVMNDIGASYTYPQDLKPWSYLPNGMLRANGAYGGPEQTMAASNILATYVRVSIGTEPVEGSGPWRTRSFGNMIFQALPLEGVDYAPGIWHWQPGDNHDGFQDIGYAHAPVTALPLGPPSATNGMALQLQSSIEGDVYDTREGILGYVDGVGPFFYGWLNPAGFPGGIFDPDAIYSYDHGQTDAGAGREDGRLRFGAAWTQQRWGALYDIVYPSGTPRGDMYLLTGGSFGNQGVMFHSLPGPGVYSDLLGPIVPFNVTHPWAIGAYREWDVVFALHLSAYPGSIFACWQRYTNAGDYYLTHFIVKEIDKVTGAEIRTISHCQSDTGEPQPGDAMSYAQASPDGQRIEWHQNGRAFSLGDLISFYNMFYIECAYGTNYPANAYSQQWWADNAVLTADAAGSDVWLKATQSAAGYYGLVSDFNGMDSFQGQACNGQALVRATAPVTVQYGMEFYDDDRVLLATQWGPATLAPAGDSTVAAVFTPPAGTFWIKMRFRSTGDAASFSIKHPGLWRPGRPVGDRSFEAFAAPPTYFFSWDAATDVLSRTAVINGADDLMGWTPDGRLVVGYVRTHQKLWNPYTDEMTTPSLEDYYGHGFNGGFVGTDGRYLYFHQLNYHIDPRVFVLGEAEIARIDPHTEGTTSGAPLPVVGDTVTVGSGIAKAFDEFYRYDLAVLDTPPGPDLVTNGSGTDDITGWQPLGNGDSHLTSPGARLRLIANTSFYSFISLYSNQGSLASTDYGNAIAIAPNRSYRISATFETDSTYVGQIFFQLRLLNADGSLYTIHSYLLPSADQGEIPHNWGYTFDAGDAVAVTLEIGIQATTAINEGSYLDVYDVQLHDVGGPVPLEWLFNLDPAFPQTYAIWNEPQYDVSSANLLTENLWNPTAPLSSADIGYQTGSASVHTSAGGVFFIEKTGGAGTVVVETAKMLASGWQYGAFDYWQALAQIQVVAGGTAGQAKIQVIGYQADGTQAWVGGLTALNLNALVPDVDAFTSLIAPNLNSPGSTLSDTITDFAVRLTLSAVSADLVLAVRRMNLRAGYSTYGIDRDPALGTQQLLAYWNSVSGDSISYDFCWWGWPQSFIPAQLGIPQLAFSRLLTDASKPTRSDIGFSRMNRSPDIGFGRMQRSIDA